MKSIQTLFTYILTTGGFLISQSFAQKAPYIDGDGNYSQIESSIRLQMDSLRNITPEEQLDHDRLITDLYLDLEQQYLDLGSRREWADALSLARACEAPFSGELSPQKKADLIYNIGYLYDKNKQYTQALDYYHRSIALYEKLHDPSVLDLRHDMALAYNNIGVVHAHTGFFTQRKKSYLKAKALWESMDSADKSNLISLYGNLLRLYRQYGDKQAANELISTINANFDQWIADEKFGTEKGALASAKSRLFYYVEKHRLNLLYTDLSDNKASGIAHLDSLCEYFDRMPVADQKRFAPHMLTAISSAAAPLVDYDDPEEFKLKKAYLELGLAESKRLGDGYNEMIFHTQLVSFLLFSGDDYESALTHLDKALEIGKKMDIREFNLLNIYLKRGDVLQQLDRFDEAREMTLLGFSLLLDEPVTNLLDVQLETFAERNDIFYINALREVAKIYKNQYRQEGKREYAQLSGHFYKIAAALFYQYYQKGIYNPWLDMTSSDINEGLIAMHLELDQNDHGLLINTMENNASQHLWKEFEAKYQQYSRVPDSLLLKRNRLTVQSGAEDVGGQRKALETVQQQIHAIDSVYTPFFESSFEVGNVQAQLLPDQLLLKYTITSTGVYVFCIRRENISVVALGQKDSVLSQVEAYYKDLQTVQAGYRRSSEALYLTLVAPVDLSEDIRTLTIIPENTLSFLPFETLINPDSGKPLVMDYAISYSHSLKLWQLQQQPLATSKNKSLLAAFSPRYSRDYLFALQDDKGPYRSRLQDIEGAAQEAEYIAAEWKGDLYKQASKRDFLENATRYQIYHFAMHALLDEADHRNSSLMFQGEEPLFYHELYGIHFPAELVVLSACNTGIGKLEKGEGLMSLSRALTYSGVRSSVYSLWQVPDKETSEIMMAFYANLKKGLSKTEALSKAKRDFLTNNPMKSHPFFWAGFVINGHTGPLPSSDTGYSVVLIIGAVSMLACTGVILAWRSRRRSRHSATLRHKIEVKGGCD